MMKDMYDWYMEHIFGIHEKKAVSYRKRQNRQTSSRRTTVPVSSVPISHFSQSGMTISDLLIHRRPGTRSKWERIGAPMVANAFDMFVILNPLTPPKARAAAITRQVDEFIYRYEISN